MSQPRDEQPPTPSARERRLDRWRDVGLAIGLTPHVVRRARLQLIVYAPLFAGVILIWDYRHALFNLPLCAGTKGGSCPTPTDSGTTALQVAVVIALVILGWQLARDFGRSLTPSLSRRLDAATAGTVGFLIRLLALVAALIAALRIADVSFAAIAIGASFSAVVFGLAAQQTLANLIAGIVLLSARPFRVGDTVRLQGGSLGGQVEGIVSALGLMYTTFDAGGDPVLVPNSVVLSVSVSPLREPEAVSMRARLPAGSTPLELQRVIEEHLTVPIRRRAQVLLEELVGTEVVVTIRATPRNAGEGGKLASELLAIVAREIGPDRAGERGGDGDQDRAT